MRAWLQAALARFRDPGDLRELLVSIAIGFFLMEAISFAWGPLPSPVTSLGTLVIAAVLVFTVVPRLRRGRW